MNLDTISALEVKASASRKSMTLNRDVVIQLCEFARRGMLAHDLAMSLKAIEVHSTDRPLECLHEDQLQLIESEARAATDGLIFPEPPWISTADRYPTESDMPFVLELDDCANICDNMLGFDALPAFTDDGPIRWYPLNQGGATYLPRPRTGSTAHFR